METLVIDHSDIGGLVEEPDRTPPVATEAPKVAKAEISGGGRGGGDQPGRQPEALVAAIRELQQQKGRCEDLMVAGTVEMGGLLDELKRQAKPKAWGQHLKELKTHPRVASRLMKIASWAHQIGLDESDLRKLPQDPLKLERIAALDRGRLDRLVEAIDCREAPRPKVIKAVKELLGQVEPSADDEDGGDPGLRMIERLLQRLIAAMKDLGAATPAGLRERLRTDLVAALETLADA